MKAKRVWKKMQTQDNTPMCYRRGNRRIQRKTSQCYENGEVRVEENPQANV